MPKPWGGTQRRHIENRGESVSIETTEFTPNHDTEWQAPTKTSHTTTVSAFVSSPNQGENLAGEVERDVNVSFEVFIPSDEGFENAPSVPLVADGTEDGIDAPSTLTIRGSEYSVVTVQEPPNAPLRVEVSRK